MEENIPTVTELAGLGSDTTALRVQCRGRSLITTLFSSPKADFLTKFSEMQSLVHAAKSCQGVQEPQLTNRSFHLEKVQAFGFFVGLFCFVPHLNSPTHTSD